MQTALSILEVVLLISLLAGLYRVVRGPTDADRMLAAQLMGTTGVGILLLLSQTMQQPVLLDIALVFALLAAVALVTFVRRGTEHRRADAGGR